MTPTRRSWLRFTGSGWLAKWLPFAAPAMARSKSVYEELGIRPMLNFRGTHTTIGASKQWPDLHASMEDAARHFVSLDELQQKVGERISRLIGCESVMITTGCAGAITLGTCGVLTGKDNAKVRQLPNLAGMKSEVIILKLHRNGYDHAVRNTGVRIVEVETAEELASAVNPKTAMMYFLGGSSGDYKWPPTVPLETCLAILHKAGVPVMVDAANMLPPWSNLQKLAAQGVDLICCSGGKHMRGPQCSGILAGRRDLIEAAKLNSSPNSDSLGRPFKVGREEIVGAWLAAEKYAKLDFEALDRECLKQAEFLRDQFAKIPGVQCGFTPSDRTRSIRRVWVSWDEAALGMTAKECEAKLMDGDPRIAVLRHEPQGLLFTVFMNDAGDEKAAARRMQEIFAKRKG